MKFGIICITLLLLSCSESRSNEQSSKIKTSESSVQLDTLIQNQSIENATPMLNTVININFGNYVCEVVVKSGINQDRKKNILLLHGWNLSHTEWCEKTALCQMAIDSGYNVIMPNFGKSTYHWELFPETIDKYKPYPTREWMYNSFLKYCQDSLGVLKPEQFNAVVGLSTGGRGAALFALEKPDVFDACVSLSADFDQTKISDEPINNGFYGSYEKFPERWAGRDNIFNRAKEWVVPLYLGHGSLDKMCPTQQTHDFSNKLAELNFKDVELSIMDKGHDYDYWDSESENIVNFLERYTPKNEQPLSK